MPALLASANTTQLLAAGGPSPDEAVGPDFQRWSGFEPLDHPASRDGLTIPYYDSPAYPGPPDREGPVDSNPRPGQSMTPLDAQTYTPSTLSRPVGTLDGQPLMAAGVSPRITRPPGAYTPARAPTVQWRLGVGQHGPSSLAAQQTVILSEITNNPPQPGDLTGIIAGLA